MYFLSKSGQKSLRHWCRVTWGSICLSSFSLVWIGSGGRWAVGDQGAQMAKAWAAGLAALPGLQAPGSRLRVSAC